MDTVSVRLENGEVLLQRLLQEGVDVAHDCGGKLACTTCQVVVVAGTESLNARSEDELDMLERAEVDDPGARLACQTISSGGEVVLQLSQSTVPARVAGSSPVLLSQPAARYLAAQLAKRAGAVAVRLAVEPAGCSGFRYRVEPVEEIGREDQSFENGGVRIVVDPLSLPYLQGTRIDLVQEGLARRLRYDNPNVRQSCGCGESFGV
jgi:iron-sulfur cluster assembly protein